MDDYVITVLSNIGMISFIGLSAYLLLVTGEISFGQQAYFGWAPMPPARSRPCSFCPSGWGFSPARASPE